MNTTYKITYRPFSGTLSVWDPIDDTLSEEMLAERGVHHQDGGDDDWYVSIMTLDGRFHALEVLDIRNLGQHWNLWASSYLTDEFITTISMLVDGWNAEYANSKDDLRVRLLTTHRTTVEV